MLRFIAIPKFLVQDVPFSWQRTRDMEQFASGHYKAPIVQIQPYYDSFIRSSAVTPPCSYASSSSSSFPRLQKTCAASFSVPKIPPPGEPLLAHPHP